MIFKVKKKVNIQKNAKSFYKKGIMISNWAKLRIPKAKILQLLDSSRLYYIKGTQY